MFNKNTLSTYRNSIVFIVIANLVPLGGILFLEWSVADLMLLYWAESGVIGIYSLIKIAIVEKWKSLFLIPFFTVHFSGFMFGHLVFLSIFFLDPTGRMPEWFIDIDLIKMLFMRIYPAIIALCISHGFSFVVNFLRKQEYKKKLNPQATMPYNRIAIMHITIIFSGFVVGVFSDAVAALILLIVIKTVVDIHSHIRVHAKLQRASSV